MNTEHFDSLAEQILEPVETVYVKLAELATQSELSSGLNPEYTKHKIHEIAKEMNIALTLVRHDVEGLLEAQSPPRDPFPDDFYDGFDSACDDMPFDGGGRPRKDLDIYDDWRNQASETGDLDK